MRITTDKIDSEVGHSFTAGEIRDLLSRLPTNWTADIETVRLSSSMHAWQIASFSKVTGRLVLCTRGKDKDVVFHAIARELFCRSTQTHPVPEWKLSLKQKKALDIKVAEQLAKASHA